MSWNSADFRRAGAFCFLFSFLARVSYERPLPSVVYSTFSCLSCQRFSFFVTMVITTVLWTMSVCQVLNGNCIWIPDVDRLETSEI